MVKRKKTNQTSTKLESCLKIVQTNILKIQKVLNRKKFKQDAPEDRAMKVSMVNNLEKLKKTRDQLKKRALLEEVNSLNTESKLIYDELSSESLQNKVIKNKSNTFAETFFEELKTELK